MVKPGLQQGKKESRRGQAGGKQVNNPIPRFPASLLEAGQQPVPLCVHQVKKAVDPTYRSEFQAVVSHFLHPKSGIPHQLNHPWQRSDPEVTRRIQVKPIPSETLGLKRIAIHRGKGEETTFLQALPAGVKKAWRVIQMFNDLPAGDGRGFFGL